MIKKITAAVAGCVVAFTGTAQTMNDDEQAVWALEERYWDYVRANDVENYRSLWDERFIGWPRFAVGPMGKENIHEWFASYHEDPTVRFDFELEPGSVRSYGPDIVAAHYLVRGYFRSSETGEEAGEGFVTRITHTWQRRGDNWVIITGMSGQWAGADEQ